MKKVTWKEVLPGVSIPVAGGRHWYYWDVGLSIVPLWLAVLMDPFGLLHYVSGRFNIPLLAAWFPSVLLIPVGIVCVIWLAVRVVGVWPRRLYPRRRLQRWWLAAALVFVSGFVLPFTGLLPVQETLFIHGLRQHMRTRADIAAIQAWLTTLSAGRSQGGSGASADGQITAPDPLPAIALLAPESVAVSTDPAGCLVADLRWGHRMMGSWGLVVEENGTTGDKKIAQFAGDLAAIIREEYVLSLARGAYVWYDPD